MLVCLSVIFFRQGFHKNCLTYEGHSRINDNEFISQNVLLDSVLFIMPHEDTNFIYSCLKFGAFIMPRFDAMII